MFSFLAFVALFLAVLFLQRNAQVAYQVGALIVILQHGQAWAEAAMKGSCTLTQHSWLPSRGWRGMWHRPTSGKPGSYLQHPVEVLVSPEERG